MPHSLPIYLVQPSTTFGRHWSATPLTKNMSQMADFHTWIRISAYFGAYALFEFTLCSVPAKDQCAAILPYIGDLVKEIEGGNVSECDKKGLIHNMIYRTLHPETVFDLLKWTIMKDGRL